MLLFTYFITIFVVPYTLKHLKSPPHACGIRLVRIQETQLNLILAITLCLLRYVLTSRFIEINKMLLFTYFITICVVPNTLMHLKSPHACGTSLSTRSRDASNPNISFWTSLRLLRYA